MKKENKCIKCGKQITEDNYNSYSKNLCEDCNNFHKVVEKEDRLEANGVIIYLHTGTVWVQGIQYISDEYHSGDDIQNILEEAYLEDMIPQGCLVDFSEEENEEYFPLNGDMENCISISHIEEILI